MPRPLAMCSLFQSFSLLLIILLSCFLATPAQAQPAEPTSPLYVQARDRITTFIDDERRVTLHGNRHPLALTQNDAGVVAPTYRMERMLLTLLPDGAQQESLNQFVDGQYNPESPYYRQWLTPEQFAERFGVSEADTTQIVGWLQGHGLEVEEVNPR